MIEITKIINPRRTYPTIDMVDVDVEIKDVSGTFPFTAVRDSKEVHVQYVWDYVQSGKAGSILPYEEPPMPTPEEIRANMPQLSMVDFRRKLRGIKVVEREGETELDGIYEADILEKIDLIADKELAAEARDYFLYAQYIERINPWVDILGAMFDLSPEEIDNIWVNE